MTGWFRCVSSKWKSLSQAYNSVHYKLKVQTGLKRSTHLYCERLEEVGRYVVISETCKAAISSLVPRPSPPPVLDCLQYVL